MKRIWLAATCGALFLVVCLPSLPALGSLAAAEAKDKEAPKAAEGANAEVEKELEHAGSDWSKGSLDLTIWSIVVFLVLLTVLWRFAWAPILQGLDRREQTIALAMEEARKAQDEARHLRADLQHQRELAAQQEREIIEQARRNGERLVEDMKNQARAQIQDETERARREVAMARDQALAELWQLTVNLATQMSSRVIGRVLDGDDHRRLFEEALAELAPAARERQQVLSGLN